MSGGHSDGGFVALDGTNMPGAYRLDLSDTIVAAAGMVTIYLCGATNMAPCVLEIEVVAVDKFDAVRMGLTALPNAAAGANGGLPLGDASGRVDVGKLLGTAWLTPGTAGTPDVNVKLISGDAAAADNAESFFDGTGYGPLLLRTAIQTVNSQTHLTLNFGNLTDALIGSRIIIRRPSTGAVFAGIITDTHTGEEVEFTLDGLAGFTITTSDIVEILPPAFGATDRTAAATLYSALTSAQAEPGQGAPAANASPLTKLAYLFKWKRNKITSTGSAINYYGDNESTIDQKQTVSLNAGTVTRNEMITGA